MIDRSALPLDPAGLFERHRGRIAILFVLCVAVYFLLAFGEQAWRAQQLQARVDEQRAAVSALDEENVALRDELATYETAAYDSYLQARARRDLNLANPGETVLMIRWQGESAAPASATATAASDDERPNWRRWLDIFAGD